ncbi:hypothetical protein [Shinella pollutisoli]|uniref:Uncharacterized protein n=1 Tax=Shinella pollutisoli TaxID=2250594 RepID=A0ABV7DKS0_9HYPH|nr:hypothetical protein [Shinella pollutisoli]
MSWNERQLVEAVEVLEGSRPGTRENAAVRIEDLAGLMELQDLQSSEVTAAPSMDDFNLLRQDVRELHTRLTAVIRALETRLA